jgi:formylglycine-generating enzyme required for sulfatase activity
MSPHLSELQGAMARIPGGRYRIGSDRFYPEERPSREVTIPEFQIELAPVTNAQFASFVAATGYVTISEQPPDPQLYPNLTSDQRLPASAVFQPPAATVDRSQPMAWWAPISPGAKNSTPMASGWLTPGRANSLGPMISTMAGSGLRLLATTPPPNGYGLVDVCGNVWEWTSSPYPVPSGEQERRIVKGGYYLCADNYCMRYRPSAVMGQTLDTATCHMGFRCASDATSAATSTSTGKGFAN